MKISIKFLFMFVFCQWIGNVSSSSSSRNNTTSEMALLPTQHDSILTQYSQGNDSHESRQLQGKEVFAVHIVGERNSGTNWLEEVLKANFKSRVNNVLCQYKHWFQPPCHKPGPYIVAVLVRNPYDWAASFYTKPYNSPMHINIPFSKFLRIQWALTNGIKPYNEHKVFKAHFDGYDTNQFVAHDQGPVKSPPNNQYPAQGRCTPKPINPDIDNKPWLKDLSYKWCGKMPIYEANPINHTAFPNIFKMRASKLRNHFDIKKWSKGVVDFISYDSIMEMEGGPEVWLADFSARHPNLMRKDNGHFITKQDTYKDEAKPFDAMKHAHSQMYFKKCIKKPYSQEDFLFANREIDWSVEAVVGYKPIPDNVPYCPS